MFFDLEKCVGHISENAIKEISEAFGRRLQNSGITRVQWVALYYIKTKGSISQRDLSNLMNVQDSSIGRLLDRLERDGMIQRERIEKDRRVSCICLTDKGDQRITDLMPVGETFSEDLVEGIDEEELIIYERVLNKMLVNVMK